MSVEPKPQSKRDIETEAPRKVLLRIAAAAFAHQPYSKVTFRGLAKSAGVSTGAYFAGWKSKADLYLEATGRQTPEAAAASLPKVADFLKRMMADRAAGMDERAILFSVYADEAEDLLEALGGS